MHVTHISPSEISLWTLAGVVWLRLKLWFPVAGDHGCPWLGSRSLRYNGARNGWQDSHSGLGKDAVPNIHGSDDLGKVYLRRTNKTLRLHFRPEMFDFRLRFRNHGRWNFLHSSKMWNSSRLRLSYTVFKLAGVTTVIVADPVTRHSRARRMGSDNVTHVMTS